MKKTRAKKQVGAALLLVMVALIILGAMTASLMETNEVYLTTTVNVRDSLQAEYLAKSGVNLSRLFLSFQTVFGRSLAFPVWQYADLVISMFTDPGGSVAAMAGVDIEGAKGLGLDLKNSELSVTIVDENSKLNVNMTKTTKYYSQKKMVNALTALMANEMYDPIFDREGTKDSKAFTREEIICEIIDWTDPDEDLCDMSGSEDRSWYEMLDPGYKRKNAPFDSLAELHMVAGIGDDFYSSFVDPDPEDPDRRVMTIWGDGKVNVNTAPIMLLHGIICAMSMDENGISPCMDLVAQRNLVVMLGFLDNYRKMFPFTKVDDFIKFIQNPPFATVLNIPGFPINPQGPMRRMLQTRSDVFSIYVKGTVGRVKKNIHVVVDMGGQDMINPMESVASSGGKVLYWRME